MKKTDNGKDWYKNQRWVKLREQILKRDAYLDQVKARHGIFRAAQIVHHIFPREHFPEYQYETWNLISLCRDTHNQLHDRTTDLLTQKGIDLLLRTCRKNKMKIPEEYLDFIKQNTINSNWRR